MPATKPRSFFPTGWAVRCAWCASIRRSRDCPNQDWTAGREVPTLFSDGYPMLVLSQASIDDLAARVGHALPVQRFRPEHPAGGVAPPMRKTQPAPRAGDARLQLTKACTRCVITTIDQATGERTGEEPLATLKRYRFDRGTARRGVRAQCLCRWRESEQSYRAVRRASIIAAMIERTVERLFFASRWLLAPIYLGLSLALFVLGIKFFQELCHTLTHVLALSEADVVLSLLALVDLTLVAGLIVMVMFSGYENFVSKIDMAGDGDKLGWLGKLDAGIAEAEGRRLDRRDLVHPPAAQVHGGRQGRERSAHVVRDHPPDLRRVGGADGRARPHDCSLAPAQQGLGASREIGRFRPKCDCRPRRPCGRIPG